MKNVIFFTFFIDTFLPVTPAGGTRGRYGWVRRGTDEYGGLCGGTVLHTAAPNCHAAARLFPQNTPLFLKKEGARGREKLFFTRKKVFPSPGSHLIYKGNRVLKKGDEGEKRAARETVGRPMMLSRSPVKPEMIISPCSWMA